MSRDVVHFHGRTVDNVLLPMVVVNDPKCIAADQLTRRAERLLRKARRVDPGMRNDVDAA